MSLIFDSFPNRQAAQSFARRMREDFGRDARVFTNREDSDAADPFPFALYGAAVVHVARLEDCSGEGTIRAAVVAHGGQFAGT